MYIYPCIPTQVIAGRILDTSTLYRCVESCGVTTQINPPWQNSYMVLHVPKSLDFYRKDNWNFCNFLYIGHY